MTDIQEGVSSMCNLGQGIEDRAIEKGIEKGIAKGETIAKMNIILNMYNNNFNYRANSFSNPNTMLMKSKTSLQKTTIIKLSYKTKKASSLNWRSNC